MVRPTGFEPVAYGLEVRCSIQLSYGRKQKGLLPKIGRVVHKKVILAVFYGTYIAFKNFMIMVYSIFILTSKVD